MWERIKTWWKSRTRVPDSARTGIAGERLAAAFLRRRGYAIVARNWRDPRDRRDEIDLVCRDGEALVFVEVKTRAAGALVSGYDAVNRRKKQVLRRVCTAYLRALGPQARPRTIRFDIVEIERAAAGDAEAAVRHFENVPLFPKDLAP